MEDDDTQHSHLIREENRTSSQAGKDSSPHPTQSQSKELSHERDSSVSDHKEHHQHHEQHHDQVLIWNYWQIYHHVISSMI
jgi:hypothetical protein